MYLIHGVRAGNFSINWNLQEARVLIDWSRSRFGSVLGSGLTSDLRWNPGRCTETSTVSRTVAYTRKAYCFSRSRFRDNSLEENYGCRLVAEGASLDISSWYGRALVMAFE